LLNHPSHTYTKNCEIHIESNRNENENYKFLQKNYTKKKKKTLNLVTINLNAVIVAYLKFIINKKKIASKLIMRQSRFNKSDIVNFFSLAFGHETDFFFSHHEN
jgi:hypothetical protein